MKIQRMMLVLAVTFASVLAAGCKDTNQTASASPGNSGSGLFGGKHVTVPSGSTIEVRLAKSVSSETAHDGDHWQGTVVNPVIIDGREAIPSGSTVDGVVMASEKAERGSRARLQLGVTSVRVRDRQTSLRASADPVIAGSTRARNLGAIAGGAAAGALIGKATSDKPGTGALIGGAVATGAVAASKGYQVVLSNGTVMTFVISEDVAVRV
jgi:hypothetical protein